MSERVSGVLLILTGVPGVGKTTVMEAVSRALRERDVPHAAVDFDALTELYPAPAQDPFQDEVGLRNLGALWGNFRSAGARHLIVAHVVETAALLERYRLMLFDLSPRVVLLWAPAADVEERLRRRPHGEDALRWHLARARELAGVLDRAGVEDLVLETGGHTPEALASEIVRGVFDAASSPWRP